MFLYKVGYHSCEESHYWDYSHEHLCLGEKGLNKIVLKCLLAAYDAEIKQNKDREPTFQDMFNNDTFRQAMIKEGFKLVVFQQQLSLFGWANKQVGDWNSYGDDITTNAQKFISKKRTKKVIDPNKAIKKLLANYKE